MTSSIKRRLLSYVVLVTLVMAVPVFALSFWYAYSEAKAFQDRTLQQIAELAQADTHWHHQVSGDQRYQLSLYSLNDPELPDWINPYLSNGFHTLKHEQQTMRLWVGDQVSGRFVIMQPTEKRDAIAWDNAISAIIPLLVLMPLLSGLIWLGVVKELRSVAEMSKAIDAQLDSIPTSLPNQSVPKELQGFISAINQLLARLHHLFLRQQRFSADAAHELRTPLSALSLQVGNLSQVHSLDQLQERLMPVTQGVERCQRLAIQLLDLNRLQVQKYSKAPVDLHAFLLDLLALYWSAAEEKQQSLSLVMADSPLMIKSHSEALSLILGNGLDNAIKYAPNHSTIVLQVTETAVDVIVNIQDQGQGIESRQLERLFEPFARADNGSVSGNGLGLSIAQTAAAQLGARLSLTNASEQGGLMFQLYHPK